MRKATSRALSTLLMATALVSRFPREAMHQSYRVTLVRLDPVPSSPIHLAPSDYRATLVVAR